MTQHAIESPSETAPANDAVVQRARKRHHVVILAISTLVVTLSFVLNVPGEMGPAAAPGGFTLPTLCWSRGLFDVECPGCGMTRSFISIAHGQFAAAWRFNPAGFVWFAAIAGQIPLRLYLLRRRDDNEPTWLPALTVVGWTLVLASCFGQWLIRLVV